MLLSGNLEAFCNGLGALPLNGSTQSRLAAMRIAAATPDPRAQAYALALPGLFKQLRAYLIASDYAGAWKFAVANGDPTKPSGLNSNAYNLYGAAANFNPLVAILETSAGINLLKVPAFSQAQMSAFYAAARNYWNGDIIGVNPYPGTEWGDPSYIPGDAVTNFNTPPDNQFPDIARFSGKHPDPSFFSKWGAVIIAVVAAIVTYGASLAATAAAAGAEAAAAEGVAAEGIAAGTSAVLTSDALAASAADAIAASTAGIGADIAASGALDLTLASTALGTAVATDAVAGAAADTLAEFTVTSTALPAAVSTGQVVATLAATTAPLAVQSLEQLSQQAATDVANQPPPDLSQTQLPEIITGSTLPSTPPAQPGSILLPKVIGPAASTLLKALTGGPTQTLPRIISGPVTATTPRVIGYDQNGQPIYSTPPSTGGLLVAGVAAVLLLLALSHKGKSHAG